MWESNSEASLEKEASKLSYKRKGLSASPYQSLSRLPTERTWSTMSTKPLIWLPKSRILSKFHHSWNLPKSRILTKFHHSWNLAKFRILSLFQHLWSLSNSEIISIYCIISTLWIHRKYSEISFITHLYSFELISTTQETRLKSLSASKTTRWLTNKTIIKKVTLDSQQPKQKPRQQLKQQLKKQSKQKP